MKSNPRIETFKKNPKKNKSFHEQHAAETHLIKNPTPKIKESRGNPENEKSIPKENGGIGGGHLFTLEE